MFKHVDMGNAMRRMADRKIEEAMRDGKFANLAGAGKPLDLEPMPADENVRMTWWAMRLFRQNEVVPDEIVYRKRIDALAHVARTARDEASLRAAFSEANEWIRKLNTMGTNAIPTDVAPIDVEAEVRRWRKARS